MEEKRQKVMVRVAELYLHREEIEAALQQNSMALNKAKMDLVILNSKELPEKPEEQSEK